MKALKTTHTLTHEHLHQYHRNYRLAAIASNRIRSGLTDLVGCCAVVLLEYPVCIVSRAFRLSTCDTLAYDTPAHPQQNVQRILGLTLTNTHTHSLIEDSNKII